MRIGDKMKICVTSKISGMDTPSAGEFIRYALTKNGIDEQ